MFSLFKSKKGCLDGKTEKQKIDFFISLKGFVITDPVFFEEQYWDLQPKEREEFAKWIEKENRNLETISRMVDVIKVLLETRK